MQICKLFHDGPLSGLSMRNRAVGGRFDSREQLRAERVANVPEYLRVFAGHCDFEGKTVVELGCSSGYLLNAFLDRERFDAIGVDIDAHALDRARESYGDRVRFLQSTHDRVPLLDESVDVIYCIDTVEHLIEARAMLIDCYRALKPGGRFLIHWHPWLGPYGSHLEDVIPFPWAHAVFSMDTLLDVAADLYESNAYNPACYWFDDETGERRPNPFVDHRRWEDFLNKMTVRQFRRLLKSLPYRVVAFRRSGFGGKAYKAGRLLSWLAHVPLADEFFLKAVVCVLEKPAVESSS
jgi:SAM-dependent methyltransferase